MKRHHRKVPYNPFSPVEVKKRKALEKQKKQEEE